MWRLTVALAAALIACGGAPPQPTAPPVLAIVEPGAEPRFLLRFAPPAIHVPERVEVRIKIRLSAAVTNTVLETGRTDADAPTIRLIASVEAKGTNAAGDALISYEIEDASLLGDFVDPRMRRMLDGEVAALKGLRATWVRAPTGLVSNVVFDSARLARANGAGLTGVADAVLQTSLRFPDQPVGKGAIWRTAYDETYAGLHWRSSVTCRVKEVSSTHAMIETSIAMRAPSQPLSVEPNATTRLTSGERTASQLLDVGLEQLTANGETRERVELNLLVVRGHVRASSTLVLESVGFFQPVGAPTE